MSRIGGFDCVPVTVFADGPLGPGSLQAWVDTDEQATERLVDLVPAAAVPDEAGSPASRVWTPTTGRSSVIHADVPDLRLLAVFDVLINNADRKGGHILGSGGRVFGVDHGVSFHTDHKLRTLLWGWAGAELNERELAAVRRARDEAPERLGQLLDEREVDGVRPPRRPAAQPKAHAPAARGVAVDPMASLLNGAGFFARIR